MKVSVFCGVSVDGFLARSNHALDFLGTGEQEPHGFLPYQNSLLNFAMESKSDLTGDIALL